MEDSRKYWTVEYESSNNKWIPMSSIKFRTCEDAESYLSMFAENTRTRVLFVQERRRVVEVRDANGRTVSDLPSKN